jgi:hypothetical protein
MPPGGTTKSQQADEVPTVSENRSRDPATVRPLLAEAAAEGHAGKSLLDAATGPVRDHWITFERGECGALKRVEVPVPDVRDRWRRSSSCLVRGLGRPPQVEEVSITQLPTNAPISLRSELGREKGVVSGKVVRSSCA